MATGHEKLETNIGLMVVLILLVMGVGGIVTVVPQFFQRELTTPVKGLQPRNPLQLAVNQGRKQAKPARVFHGASDLTL